MIQDFAMNEDELENLIQIAASFRPVRGGWTGSTKHIRERDAARTVLEGLGHNVKDLHSPENDPPDCVAIVDGQLSAIEVTELVDRRSLEKALKARRATEWWPGIYDGTQFEWTRESFLAFLATIIAKKDAKARLEGFSRYFLVIVTDETFLWAARVSEFLKSASFPVKNFTDVMLGLGYHRAPNGGSYPCYRLTRTGI